MDEVLIFTERLKRLGIEVELLANYPWIYLDKINGKQVTEKYQANHGFTVAFYNRQVYFTDTKEIFALIRKYINN
jgi:hypothetical protein